MAAYTIIIRHDIAITVPDDTIGTMTRRNALNLVAGRAILLLLFILLADKSAAAYSDNRTHKDDGGKGYGGHVNENISKIDTTKIDIDLLNNVAARRERTAKSIMDFQYNEFRNRWFTDTKILPAKVRVIIYWMYREQRVQDNWALLYAQKLAISREVPLHVVYCTPLNASGITLRQYKFMIEGLKGVESELRDLNIPFHFSFGSVVDIFVDFSRNHHIGAIVVDFFPLRDFIRKTRQLAAYLFNRVPVIMVDAHNVVPFLTQNQINYASIYRVYNETNGQLKYFLTEFPPVIKHPFDNSEIKPKPFKWEETQKNFQIDSSVIPVSGFKAGYREGILELENFMKNRLENYTRDSINPMKNGLSNLSPWLHFGQISPQRVILEIKRFSNKYLVDDKSFMREIFKRRELSDIYCSHHLNNYDKVTGTRRWAQVVLHRHRNDTREHTYTRDEFEYARTHDDLWNAAQLQMMIEGKMHRFLRMYWGKKILDWTDTPENALANAIYLNNKYSLDGNDPNSYNGCMWAICGLHDRPFKNGVDRPVIGTLRYINVAWCKMKFDWESFVKKYQRYNYIKE